MRYTIKAHPTKYAGVEFRSRLEATWAAFFSLIDWHWEYEPIDIDGWVPDFYIEFPCNHSECAGKHCFYVEVKPFRSIAEFADFKAHALMRDHLYEQPGIALFGLNPGITEWHMCHGAGAGASPSLYGWLCGDEPIEELWTLAQNITRWKPNAA